MNVRPYLHSLYSRFMYIQFSIQSMATSPHSIYKIPHYNILYKSCIFVLFITIQYARHLPHTYITHSPLLLLYSGYSKWWVQGKSFHYHHQPANQPFIHPSIHSHHKTNHTWKRQKNKSKMKKEEFSFFHQHIKCTHI